MRINKFSIGFARKSERMIQLNQCRYNILKGTMIGTFKENS